MRRRSYVTSVSLLALLSFAACSSTSSDPAPPAPTTLGTCRFEPLPPTARAGGTVRAGAVSVGTAEADLGLPIGSALGGYTSRVALLGSDGRPDDRDPRYSGAFVPSVGVETRPRVKALAITAGDETVVMLHADVGAMYDGVLFEVERRLGPEFSGKVIATASHTHGGPGHFVGNSILQLGFGAFREQSFERIVTAFVDVATVALDARQPARIGIAHAPDFDPDDTVSRDRRAQNDDLPGGSARKDHDLFVLRADATDGTPLALVPIFGVHPTVLGAGNNLASNDVAGAIEVALEESFDRPVLVMHLQQAAGDVSPAGTGGIDCEGVESCFDFARGETVGRYARDAILAAWEAAPLVDTLEMEMVTRTIALGPDLTALTARDGALTYLPYEPGRVPDGVLFTPDGEVSTPIDEFNVAFGAGLCGEASGGLGDGIEGTSTLGAPYQSCSTVEGVVQLLRIGVGDDWYFEDPLPSCATTRTTLSALRLGDHLFVTLPGEPLNPLVDRIRAASPVAADRTVVLGYAQDHMGYVLHADDWLRGGYEPSINVWGPIEGEYIAEAAVSLAGLALTPEREDATADGVGRVLPGPYSAAVDPDPSPQAGTVPETVPESLYLRPDVDVTQAQPRATIPRLGLNHFVWVGEDPVAGTPTVTIEREQAGGTFAPLTRRSGRVVRDRDLLLLWTPTPLEATEGPRTHHWVAEWQAVPATGSADDTDLDARAALPLGRYRFHVEGVGYTLTSDPFEVVPASLETSVVQTASQLELDVARDGRGGFRLLDLEMPSNARVPIRAGDVEARITVEGGGAPVSVTASVSDGRAIIPWTDNDGVVMEVRVTDAYGNLGVAMPTR